MNTEISERSSFLEFPLDFMTLTFFYNKSFSLEASFHEKVHWVILMEKDWEGGGREKEGLLGFPIELLETPGDQEMPAWPEEEAQTTVAQGWFVNSFLASPFRISAAIVLC